MTTGPTFTVSSPTPGTEYIAPAAYWVVPNGSSQVKCNVESFDSSGNVVSVTSITAIIRDVTTSQDKGSFTYNNGYGANCLFSGPNGADVFAPAGKVGSSCAQLRMWLTYTGTVYDQPPNAPSNLSPAGQTTTLTPEFYATFSDPTSGDTLAQFQLQVQSAAGGGGSTLWDSGTVNANSTEISNAKFGRVYGSVGGSATALTYGHTYSWRCRMANQRGNWGPWSGYVNFNTIQGPAAPSVTAPSGLQATLTPNLSYGYSSPASVAQASYRYTITAAAGGALVYDSGVVTASLASGGTQTGAIPSGAGLQYGGSYIFNVTATDTNGVASPTSSSPFQVATPPQIAPVTPTGNATVNTQTPTFVWSYTDANYAQGQAQIEIQNAATDTDLLLTGWLAQSATQYTSGTTIAYGTAIRWRVQVQDTAGLGSGWSTWAYAVVNNTPQATITSPTPLAALATITPTIAWTYTASSGGQPQASATITLLDANGNQIAAYTQAGAATSYTLPAGVLANGQQYHVQVSVTDTASSTGASAIIAFTVSLTPPADMQGQLLANGKNYLLGALLTTDVNANGIADSWATSQSTGFTAALAIDDDMVQPNILLASGDGSVSGAQNIVTTVAPAAGAINLTQAVSVATAGWVAGTTALSVAAQVFVTKASGGNPYALLELQFLNSGGGVISQNLGSSQYDTAGIWVRLLGPQNITIPAGCVTVNVLLRFFTVTTADLGSIWWCQAQLEAAAASDSNCIEGSLGTGFTYDSNGFSVRTQITGGFPTVVANPGADGDPISAQGGSVVFSWDTTLADSRFTAYLIERRRIDEQTDDTAWQTLATLTNKSQGSYTDYTPGSNTTYQYAVRQTIAYTGAGVGISANRAIVIGSVSFSPAWYLTNAASSGAALANVRLTVLSPQRTLSWKENAKYSLFLGRVGAARDAGQPQGYTYPLVCYFDDSFGDNRQAIRRQFVSMQRQNALWYLKDPEGLVVPVFLQDVQFGEQDTDSDTLLTLTLNLLQAQDTQDY